jgi:hypothetical protein
MLCKQYLLSALGPLIGHASDGDARRRKLQLEDYKAAAAGAPGAAYTLVGAPGFLFAAHQDAGQPEAERICSG